jgi:hypothetical protein
MSNAIDNLDERFQLAVTLMDRTLRPAQAARADWRPAALNAEQHTALYSFYKQATEGDCKTPRPGVFTPVGRMRWYVSLDC